MLMEEDWFVGERGRSAIALYFPKPGIVAVNLHMPHSGKASSHLSDACRKVTDAVGKKNVLSSIVTGDFNDKDGTITSNSVFHLCGKKTSMQTTPPLTCCKKQGMVQSGRRTVFSAVGDYVLSSRPISLLFSLDIPYSSDHAPCVAVLR